MASPATKAKLRPPFLKAALIGLATGVIGTLLQFGGILHMADGQLSGSVDKLLAKAQDTAKVALVAPALGVGDALAANLLEAGYIEKVRILDDKGGELAKREAQRDADKREALVKLLDHAGISARAYSRQIIVAPDPQDPEDKGATGTLELTVDRAAAIAASMSGATALMLGIAFLIVGGAGFASTLGFWYNARKRAAVKALKAKS